MESLKVLATEKAAFMHDIANANEKGSEMEVLDDYAIEMVDVERENTIRATTDDLVGAPSPSRPLPSSTTKENPMLVLPGPTTQAAPLAWTFEATQKLIRGNHKPTKEVRVSFIKNDSDVVIIPKNEIDHD